MKSLKGFYYDYLLPPKSSSKLITLSVFYIGSLFFFPDFYFLGEGLESASIFYDSNGKG